jgi:SAM-dependent methyltransferase
MTRWTDRAFLRDVQYRTDANLTARQSIYAYQQPPVDMIGGVLDLVRPPGTEAEKAETVADIGCGNGLYLAELARRGRGGHLVGMDLSLGMLHAVRQRTRRPALLAADAAALPLRDGSADLTLAMHMLYHVPEPELAVRELRRITRGRLVVGLNGVDHHREMRELITAALASLGHDPVPLVSDRFNLDQGETLLRRMFTSVTRYDFPTRLVLPGPEPVAAYVRSLSVTSQFADPEVLVRAVTTRLPDGPFEDTSHGGFLMCGSAARRRADGS